MECRCEGRLFQATSTGIAEATLTKPSSSTRFGVGGCIGGSKTGPCVGFCNCSDDVGHILQGALLM